MRSINVRYFALLRETAGVEKETLQTTATTCGGLYEELRDRYRFSLPADMIQVAVDDEFARLDSDLRDGATVVFIPPVAGG